MKQHEGPEVRFNDRRLIPYIQVHEFEALLFVDLDALAPLFVDEDYTQAVKILRTSVEVGNPELINAGRETSPSRRLMQFLPGYETRKTEVGPDAAKAAALPAFCRMDRQAGSITALPIVSRQ